METRKHILKDLNYTFKIVYDENSGESLPIKTILSDIVNSYLDKPDQIILPGKVPVAISGITDKLVLKAIEKKNTVTLRNEKNGSYISWITVTGYCMFGIKEPIEKYSNMSFDPIKDFFKVIVSKLNIDYAYVHANESESKLREIYNQQRRTFFSSGLYWLNFFGSKEESKQGGQALENNSFATDIERFPNGLFIQVGDTPFDCFAPEGEQRLINATKAMPPVSTIQNI